MNEGVVSLSDDTLIAKLNVIDAEIRHEDELVGQRMTWLVISQSFLFGTFVALVGQKGVVGPAAGAVKLLLLLVPLVAVLLPVVLLVAMGAAFYAMAQWRAEQTRIFRTPEAKHVDWPHLRHRSLITALGQSLPIVVSIVFLLAWITILIQMATG